MQLLFQVFLQTKEWFTSQKRFETLIEEMKKEDLTDCLKVFHAAVKQKDGKDFNISSLSSIRAAIERYLKQPPINKPWFNVGATGFETANKVLSASCRNNPQEGKDLETTSEAPFPQNPHIPFELSNTTLSPVENEKLRALLLQYQDIFAPTGSQLGHTNIVQYTITTGEAPPIKLRPYGTSPTQREEIDKQITDMLSQNIIHESVSPWSAPVVLVKKKVKVKRGN